MNIDFTQKLLSILSGKLRKLKPTSASESSEYKKGFKDGVQAASTLIQNDREEILKANDTLTSFNIKA